MKRILLFGVTIFLINNLNAQSEHKLIRRGNKAFEKNDYLESEVQYRQALEKNKHSFKANFNLADALYKQNKFEESLSAIDGINLSGLSDMEKSMVYYNKGNALFKQNKLKESIEAYKKALKYNPNDMDAKYNLSLALRMMQQLQQQNNQQDNKQDNKDKNDNKENQKEDNKDKKDNDKNKDQKQNQNQDQDQKDKQQQQQPKISKEDAERMLQALQQREKEIQDKIKKKQAKPVSGATIKNW
ncbi:MAG: Ca-activated chloride channel [Tenuifilum sp.]|jgi:tetratricopeptide (TPR) repeat protein|uniref:tetratricopeptide repeat protein n=1 Tax=Tenuifilum sp. TaxID=2760880 RepID=UPI0024AC3518|nr:tetratricopeptide repeat protein [Tenuifilum sp.]MDI3527636.1 Ca-activated chloride channel [Tenuifilum sp.]